MKIRKKISTEKWKLFLKAPMEILELKKKKRLPDIFF